MIWVFLRGCVPHLSYQTIQKMNDNLTIVNIENRTSFIKQTYKRK